jgi:hypothetical protein
MPILNRLVTDNEKASAKDRREFEQSPKFKEMVKRQEKQEKAYNDRREKADARAAKSKKPMQWIGFSYRRP